MTYLVNPSRFVTAGGDPTITFTWDPENDEALPGGASFSRASVKQEFDGTDFTELSSGTIPENTAAVDGGAQGFHPEPAATNQIPNVDFTDAAWAQSGCTPSSNGTNALNLAEYTSTADVINAKHRLAAVPASGGAGSAYFIAKEGTGGDGGRYIILRRGATATQDYATYDLQSGTVSEEGSGITEALITDLGNSYYKTEVNTTDSLATLSFYMSDTGTPGNADRGWLGASETSLVCHAQYEKTIFSTSPIVTTGSAAARVADVLDTGVVIPSEFSVLLDVTLPLVIGSGNTITLLGPDATAEDVLRVDASFNVIMDDGGTPTTIGTSSSGARIKVAYGRDSGDRSGSLDGATAVDGDAPGSGHEGDNFELGSANGVNQSRCIHHLTTIYDEKKSDAELEALAT